MTFAKTYEFIAVDENKVNEDAYNELCGIMNNWEDFIQKEQPIAVHTLLRVINELMMGVMFERDNKLFELQKKIAQFESGGSF